MVIVLIGAALLAFTMLLMSLFFQLSRVEHLLDKTVETVEVYLLQEYGEIRTDRNFAQDSLDDDDDGGDGGEQG